MTSSLPQTSRNDVGWGQNVGIKLASVDILSKESSSHGGRPTLNCWLVDSSPRDQDDRFPRLSSPSPLTKECLVLIFAVQEGLNQLKAADFGFILN